LVLSTDYELFFQKSGSIQNCLLDPAEALLRFTRKRGMTMTFYVDTGMLRRYAHFAKISRRLARDLELARTQLREIAAAGHELGLHIHPHWEDTRFEDGRWDFSDSRYRLDQFSEEEVAELLKANFGLLQDLSEEPIESYRAGGFCVEPFDRIAPIFSNLGIWIDSSVVPGARLKDTTKGFDFGRVADRPWWRFDKSPTSPSPDGRFLEVAITPTRVSRFFYWGRLIRRLKGATGGSHFGDGIAKAIGKPEVVRRLLGQSRVSEMSMDDAKSPFLQTNLRSYPEREVWHVMGHPKLLSKRSLDLLDGFLIDAGIELTQSVRGYAVTC
jgi:hypothetical protein